MKKTWIAALLLASLAALLPQEAKAFGALYLLGGLDGKMLTNQDANNYFNLPGGQLGPMGLPSGVVHLGLQMGVLSIEASLNQGPGRENSVTYQNFGVTTRSIKTRWSVSTLSVTPGLSWITPGGVSMLGLRVGEASLSGHVDDNAYGSAGAYDSEAKALDGGILFRSSAIMAGHLSVGLEFGYDWTMFKDISNKNGSGSYATPHSPERNVSNTGHNGDPTVLDFSGAHVALVVGLWSALPASSSHASLDSQP